MESRKDKNTQAWHFIIVLVLVISVSSLGGTGDGNNKVLNSHAIILD